MPCCKPDIVKDDKSKEEKHSQIQAKMHKQKLPSKILQTNDSFIQETQHNASSLAGKIRSFIRYFKKRLSSTKQQLETRLRQFIEINNLNEEQQDLLVQIKCLIEIHLFFYTQKEHLKRFITQIMTRIKESLKEQKCIFDFNEFTRLQLSPDYKEIQIAVSQFVLENNKNMEKITILNQINKEIQKINQNQKNIKQFQESQKASSFQHSYLESIYEVKTSNQYKQFFQKISFQLKQINKKQAKQKKDFIIQSNESQINEELKISNQKLKKQIILIKQQNQKLINSLHQMQERQLDLTNEKAKQKQFLEKSNWQINLLKERNNQLILQNKQLIKQKNNYQTVTQKTKKTKKTQKSKLIQEIETQTQGKKLQMIATQTEQILTKEIETQTDLIAEEQTSLLQDRQNTKKLIQVNRDFLFNNLQFHLDEIEKKAEIISCRISKDTSQLRQSKQKNQKTNDKIKIQMQSQDSAIQLLKSKSYLIQLKLDDIDKKLKSQIFISELQLSSKVFFQGQVLNNYLQEKMFLIQSLESMMKKKIVLTKMLYSLNQLSPFNFHTAIDNIPCVALVLRTNNTVLGAFYVGVIRPDNLLDDALLLQLSNKKSYPLITPANSPQKFKEPRNVKSMNYDQYYVIYGNAELRVRALDDKVYCNFGNQNGVFYNKKDKLNDFFKENDSKETKMLQMEFHQVFFG